MSASEIHGPHGGDALALRLDALIDEVRALRSDLHAEHQDARARAALEGMDALITQEQFAAILAVDVRTIRRLNAAGELPPSISLTSRPRWRRSDVMKFVKALKGSR